MLFLMEISCTKKLKEVYFVNLPMKKIKMSLMMMIAKKDYFSLVSLKKVRQMIVCTVSPFILLKIYTTRSS